MRGIDAPSSPPSGRLSPSSCAPPFPLRRREGDPQLSNARPPPSSGRATSAWLPTWKRTHGDRSGEGIADPGVEVALLHPEEEVESFFGQLWAIPSSIPCRLPTRVSSSNGFLAWVRKDLVRDRKITTEECYPVWKFDRIEGGPIRISYSRDIWGNSHQRESYAEVVKRKMAEERGRWVWQPEIHPPPQRPPPTRPLRRDPPPTRQQQQPPPRSNQQHQQAQGGRNQQGSHPGGGQIQRQQQRPLQQQQRKPENTAGEWFWGCSSYHRCQVSLNKMLQLWRTRPFCWHMWQAQSLFYLCYPGASYGCLSPLEPTTSYCCLLW
ncbi:hypothetical protein PVAP13_3KG282627 [Panicum virgatum]|uniref:Uncharacterized protein n=1 Tax=Panicum virgatum TaxID=38727 RepID=A0A8T0UV73_PANVG|nr:hypothetical protein PVAP13_3KG282627 [Panicum virgatum]